MKAEDKQTLRQLLTSQRVAALAVLLDGRPYTGLMAFAVRPDFSAVLIHASDLARHTAGLQEGAAFSLLVHLPDSEARNPLAIPRVSLQGRVCRIPRETEAYRQAKQVYRAKFPDSEQVFALKDFNFYELVIETGRFVAGFGAIYNLTPQTLRAYSTA